jgi:hypothetical protein
MPGIHIFLGLWKRTVQDDGGPELDTWLRDKGREMRMVEGHETLPAEMNFRSKREGENGTEREDGSLGGSWRFGCK